MSDVTVKYKGQTIFSSDSSFKKKFDVQANYCEDDLHVQYVKPSGSSYVKLAEAEFTVNHSSTSATLVGNVDVTPSTDLWRSDAVILVKIRDKVGKRNGYFLGGDYFFINPIPVNGGTETTLGQGTIPKVTYSVDINGAIKEVAASYGVYAYDISNNGRVRIYVRYHSASSLTIDGTYKVEVWALKYPNNVSPFA